MKSTQDIQRERQSRLKEVDKAHRTTLSSLQTTFNKVYDDTLRRHKLTINCLMDHHALPLYFHEDEALVAAKKEYLVGLRLAQEAKRTSVAQRVRRSGVVH